METNNAFRPINISKKNPKKVQTRADRTPFYKATFGRVTNATWSQLACHHAANKVIVVIRQYGPNFATAHCGI
jgi:hypothetical protein